MHLKQWKQALDDYTKAISDDPSYVHPWVNRAFVYSQLNDVEHAVADASKTIELDPKKAFAYEIRAFGEEQYGKWDAAVADFTKVIELSGGNERSFFNRGVAIYSVGKDLDRAIADFGEALKRNPNYGDALVYRGLASRAKGHLDKAIADHTSAIRIDQRNAAAYFNRGLEYYLTSALPKALADLTQAAALEPRQAYPALLLDVVATRSGLASQLKAQSDKLDMGQWPAPAVRLLIGQITPEALIAAAEDANAAAKPARLCEAAFYTGVVLARNGQGQQATVKWQEALAKCPPSVLERSYAEVELKAQKKSTR